MDPAHEVRSFGGRSLQKPMQLTNSDPTKSRTNNQKKISFQLTSHLGEHPVPCSLKGVPIKEGHCDFSCDLTPLEGGIKIGRTHQSMPEKDQLAQMHTRQTSLSKEKRILEKPKFTLDFEKPQIPVNVSHDFIEEGHKPLRTRVTAVSSPHTSTSPRRELKKYLKIGSDEKSPLKSPERDFMKCTFDSYDNLDDIKNLKTVILFNSHLKDALIKESLKYVWVNLDKPENIISFFCSESVLLFFKKNQLTKVGFESHKIDFYSELINQIRVPQFFFMDVIVRLNSLKENLQSYLAISRCKTQFAVNLYYLVDDLIKCSNIVDMLYIVKKMHVEHEHGLFANKKLENFVYKTDCHERTIEDLILGCFGHSKEKINNRLDTLKKLSIDSDLVEHEIAKAVTQTVDLLEVTSQRHLWIQDPKYCPINLNTIEVLDIRRSWKQSKIVLFNKVVINNRDIYPFTSLVAKEMGQRVRVKHDEEGSTSSLEEITDYDLYHFIAKAIYDEGFNPGPLSVEEQIKKFIKIDSCESKNIDLLTLEREIPFLSPLKLTTMKCFLPGMDYFHCLFPSLAPLCFELPKTINFFELVKVNGIDIQIEIFNPQKFAVTQLKKVNVCLTSDRSQIVATLEISWKVSSHKNKWNGILGIKSCRVHLKEHRRKLISILANPAKVSFSQNLPDGVRFFPCYMHTFAES